MKNGDFMVKNGDFMVLGHDFVQLESEHGFMVNAPNLKARNLQIPWEVVGLGEKIGI